MGLLPAYPPSTAILTGPVDQGAPGALPWLVTGPVVAAQGAAGAAAWPVEVRDGPLAASIVGAAPTSADPALVTVLSPLQGPVPTTVVPNFAIPGSAVGRAAGLSAGVLYPVRSTPYIEQTTQGQRSIRSTVASDTAAGAGARVVRLTYHNAICEGPFVEDITLNGTAWVNTVASDVCFIERVEVISVGASGSNDGVIEVNTLPAGAGVVFASIGRLSVYPGAGDNVTLYAHHYVPPTRKIRGYLVTTGIFASAGGGSAEAFVRGRNPTVAAADRPWTLISDVIQTVQGATVVRPYETSISAPGPLVIVGWTVPGKNGSTATLSFDYAEEPI